MIINPYIFGSVPPTFAQIFGANYYDDWDFNNASSLTLTGTNIDSIASLTGSGRNFTQTGGARPILTFDATIQKNIGLFDGVSSFMQIPTSTGLYNFLHSPVGGTVIFVNRINPLNLDHLSLYINNGRGSTAFIGYTLFYDNRLSISRNNVIAQATGGGVIGTGTNNVSANNYTSSQKYHSLVNVTNPNTLTLADRSSLILDGGTPVKNNTLSGTASTANASDNMTLGRISNASSFFHNGQIARIIVINAQATAQQLIDVQLRLTYEYGLLPI